MLRRFWWIGACRTTSNNCFDDETLCPLGAERTQPPTLRRIIHIPAPLTCTLYIPQTLGASVLGCILRILHVSLLTLSNNMTGLTTIPQNPPKSKIFTPRDGGPTSVSKQKKNPAPKWRRAGLRAGVAGLKRQRRGRNGAQHLAIASPASSQRLANKVAGCTGGMNPLAGAARSSSKPSLSCPL